MSSLGPQRAARRLASRLTERIAGRSDMPPGMDRVVVDMAGRKAVLFGYQGDAYFEQINDHLYQSSVFVYELKRLPPGAVICDVGANIGTSAIYSAFVVPDSRVLSFEPSPRALACLKRAVDANNLANVEIVEAAVGARAGRVALAETDYLAGSHLVPVEGGAFYPATAEVPVVALDDYLIREKKLERLDLLKIDVEGFELDVLDGAMEVIERFRPRLVVEYSAFAIVVNADGSPLRLLQRLLDLAGPFDILMPWGGFRLESTPKSVKDFIFANMRVGAQDLTISVRPDYPGSPS